MSNCTEKVRHGNKPAPSCEVWTIQFMKLSVNTVLTELFPIGRAAIEEVESFCYFGSIIGKVDGIL